MTKLSDTQRKVLLKVERGMEDLQLGLNVYQFVRNGRVVENVNARTMESLLLRGLLQPYDGNYIITVYGIEALTENAVTQ